MAERVIDRFEIIKIEEKYGDRHVVTNALLNSVIDAVTKKGPVGDLGQRVVQGLMRKLVLERLALGHVHH